MNNKIIGTLSDDDIDYIHKVVAEHYSDGDIIECNGLVIVLDVLGWQESAKKETIQNLFIQLNKLRGDYLDACLRCSDDRDKFNVYANAIADNIVIFVNGDFPYHSYNIYYELGKLVANSLKMGIAFRGAINYGEFYINKLGNSYVGQVVYDTIKYADKTDWAGLVIMTPLADALLENNDLEELKKLNIVQYDEIPYKDCFKQEYRKYNLTVLPNRDYTGIDYVKAYNKYMDSNNESIKIKRENTIKFINFIEANYWNK